MGCGQEQYALGSEGLSTGVSSHSNEAGLPPGLGTGDAGEGGEKGRTPCFESGRLDRFNHVFQSAFISREGGWQVIRISNPFPRKVVRRNIDRQILFYQRSNPHKRRRDVHRGQEGCAAEATGNHNRQGWPKRSAGNQ